MEPTLETFISTMTLAELSAKTGKSVTAIAEFAVNGKAHNKTADIEVSAEASEPKAKTKAKKAKAKASGVNVRSAEGREAYREAVYTAVVEHGDFVGAETLRATVGGEATQLRAALKALVADKRLSVKGQARGTMYGVKGSSKTKEPTEAKKTAKAEKPAKKSKGKKKAPPRVAATKADTLDVRVLKYLRKRNAICTTEEIAEALGVVKGTVTKAIKGMEIDATIEPKERKDGTGGFVITEKGKTSY
jgi:uncharacterized membrane protein